MRLEPFSTPDLQVLDGLRVICIVLGVVLEMFLARLWLNMRSDRFAREAEGEVMKRWDLYIAALGLYGTMTIAVGVGRLGTPVTWILPLNCAAVVAGISAVVRTMKLPHHR